MNIKFSTAILLFPIALAACTSPPSAPKNRPPLDDIFFATSIKPNHEKMFSFSMTLEAPKNENKRSRKGQSSRGKGMGPTDRDNDVKNGNAHALHEANLTKLYRKLELKLLETGYCREGYTEINMYETTERLQLMGKCHELATDDDQKIFISSY